jgi:hypothetical protein
MKAATAADISPSGKGGDKLNADALKMYYDGMTVAQVGKAMGVSTGKAYYILRDSGCIFRKNGFREGFKMPREAVEKSAKARTGIKRKAETRAKLSESRKCHFNGLNGYGHTKLHPKGYVLAYAPEHPNAHKDGYIMMHTVVVEQNIGRYLKDGEVVHHINHIRSDNDINNLLLMDKREHAKMHMNIRNMKRRDALSTV